MIFKAKLATPMQAMDFVLRMNELGIEAGQLRDNKCQLTRYAVCKDFRTLGERKMIEAEFAPVWEIMHVNDVKGVE